MAISHKVFRLCDPNTALIIHPPASVKGVSNGPETAIILLIIINPFYTQALAVCYFSFEVRSSTAPGVRTWFIFYKINNI